MVTDSARGADRLRAGMTRHDRDATAASYAPNSSAVQVLSYTNWHAGFLAVQDEFPKHPVPAPSHCFACGDSLHPPARI